MRARLTAGPETRGRRCQQEILFSYRSSGAKPVSMTGSLRNGRHNRRHNRSRSAGARLLSHRLHRVGRWLQPNYVWLWNGGRSRDSKTLRRKALNLLNGISIGLRSGEYCGRYCTVAPKASITSFTPGTLWAGRLSITTMSLHLSIGARHCPTQATKAGQSIGQSMTIGATILLCRKAPLGCCGRRVAG